jgi:hypothetical protein
MIALLCFFLAILTSPLKSSRRGILVMQSASPLPIFAPPTEQKPTAQFVDVDSPNCLQRCENFCARNVDVAVVKIGTSIAKPSLFK